MQIPSTAARQACMLIKSPFIAQTSSATQSPYTSTAYRRSSSDAQQSQDSLACSGISKPYFGISHPPFPFQMIQGSTSYPYALQRRSVHSPITFSGTLHTFRLLHLRHMPREFRRLAFGLMAPAGALRVSFWQEQNARRRRQRRQGVQGSVERAPVRARRREPSRRALRLGAE